MTLTRRTFGAAAALAAPYIRTARAQQALEWVAGTLNGNWYAMASGISALVQEEAPDIHISVIPGGSIANPTRIQNGLSQIGWSFDFLALSAARGEPPYTTSHEKLRSLGTGYAPTEHHFIRHADGPPDMEAIVTLAGARIGTPPRSSSDTLTFRRILKFYGTSPEKLREAGGRYVNGTYTDLIAAWNDGQIDYVYAALARPAATVTELAQGARKASLVSFPPALRDHMTRTYGYGQGRIPVGTYPELQADDIQVTTMDSVILVGDSMSDDLAEQITTILIRNRGERLAAIHPSMAAFDPVIACKYRGVPLHPGAAKAFASACTV